jgi:hypothetical protein
MERRKKNRQFATGNVQMKLLLPVVCCLLLIAKRSLFFLISFRTKLYEVTLWLHKKDFL